jgi:hypothetical protein
MMSKIKIINGIQVPPLFYKKRYFKGAFIAAMIGLAGVLISIGRFVIYFHGSTKNVTETDIWEVLVVSLFLLAIFLPASLLFYFSHKIMRIIDTLIEKSTDDSTGI